MKRSKIFLGITTGVLAIVAFSAAKVAKFTTTKLGYYSVGNANGAKCTLSGGSTPYYTSGSVQAQETVTSQPYSLFEKNSGKCAIPLFTERSTTD